MSLNGGGFSVVSPSVMTVISPNQADLLSVGILLVCGKQVGKKEGNCKLRLLVFYSDYVCMQLHPWHGTPVAPLLNIPSLTRIYQNRVWWIVGQ